jgi:hypothetical protein
VSGRRDEQRQRRQSDGPRHLHLHRIRSGRLPHRVARRLRQHLRPHLHTRSARRLWHAGDAAAHQHGQQQQSRLPRCDSERLGRGLAERR